MPPKRVAKVGAHAVSFGMPRRLWSVDSGRGCRSLDRSAKEPDHFFLGRAASSFFTFAESSACSVLSLSSSSFNSVSRSLRSRAELLQRLANAAAHAAVLLELEVTRESPARFGVAHLGKRAHHVDADMRVPVVEQLFERFAVLALGGELGKRHDGGAAAAAVDSVLGSRENMSDRAVVAQRGQAVECAHANDVGPRRAIEDLDQRVERDGLPSLAERSRRF